jgi:hypothetical protein
LALRRSAIVWCESIAGYSRRIGVRANHIGARCTRDSNGVKLRLLGLSADGEILPKLIEAMSHHRSYASDAKPEIA